MLIENMHFVPALQSLSERHRSGASMQDELPLKAGRHWANLVRATGRDRSMVMGMVEGGGIGLKITSGDTGADLNLEG
jgi:hypothetical protein